MSELYSFTGNMLSEIQIPPEGMASHTLFNDHQTRIVLFGFAAGHEMAPHAAPAPAIIQVLSGEVTLTLGEDRCEAGPGSLVHMAPKLMHGIVAKTAAVVLLTLLKSLR